MCVCSSRALCTSAFASLALSNEMANAGTYNVFVLCSLSHSFVGTQQFSVLFASIRIHTRHWTEWVRSHLFYELTPAAPTPLHQHTHTKGPSRAIPACVSNVENTGKNSVVGRFFTFALCETFRAVLRNGLARGYKSRAQFGVYRCTRVHAGLVGADRDKVPRP